MALDVEVTGGQLRVGDRVRLRKGSDLEMMVGTDAAGIVRAINGPTIGITLDSGEFFTGGNRGQWEPVDSNVSD